MRFDIPLVHRIQNDLGYRQNLFFFFCRIPRESEPLSCEDMSCGRYLNPHDNFVSLWESQCRRRLNTRRREEDEKRGSGNMKDREEKKYVSEIG